MRKTLFCIFYLFIITVSSFSQTVKEKEVFKLKYKGIPDVYSFYTDGDKGKSAYLYFLEDEKKYFMIFQNSISDKYDYISAYDQKYDSKGNSYIIAGNYNSDFGIDNNFLLVNGKEVLNSNYIESYSSFVNKKDEFVFIYKEKDLFKIGKYSPGKGLQKSENYNIIRTVFDYDDILQREGDADGYTKDEFYTDENGERCFIAVKNGIANLIYETREVKTNYSDIIEASITKNKNGELSFIAKKKGTFYETKGNEVVVSGSKEYDVFETINPPLLFNSKNEPVYSCSDSVDENKSIYYLVIGSDKQKIKFNNSDTTDKINFSSWISDLKIDENDKITFFGMDEVIIPADRTNLSPGQEVYDEYYSKSYFVKNNFGTELGYNVGQIKYSKNGEMLYSGIADLYKKEYLIIESNGISNIILNDEIFDQINDYGYTPNDEIYFVSVNYEDQAKNKKYESKLFIGNKLTGTYDYMLHQSKGDENAVLKFDSKNNYAFVVENIADTTNYNDRVYVNNKILPLPENIINGGKKFSLITGLMYSNNDKLFYTGQIKISENEFYYEIFIDNKTAGKTYDVIGNLKYDDSKNELTFYASKKNKIYLVTVKF